MKEKGKVRKTGPAYTAGPRAVNDDSLFPISGRIPRDNPRNTTGERKVREGVDSKRRADLLVPVP